MFLHSRVCVHVTQLQLERDELHRTHTENIDKVQHKAGVKSMLLEKKLKVLTDSVEKTQAQLCAVLSASNMDQTALTGITDKIKVLSCCFCLCH